MKFLEKWQRVWMAVTFAEANEPETACQFIKPGCQKKVKRARIYV